VAVDFTAADRDGADVDVTGRVTVRWSDGGGEEFGGFRFVDAGPDLLLADYANAAGPLSAHLVDGTAVAAAPAGDSGVDVALVAAVWLAPDPVVAVTVRLRNGTDGPVGLAADGVTFTPSPGDGPAVVADYGNGLDAPPGGTGWVLAELRGDPLPTGGGRLEVTVADADGAPLGTAALDLPAFPGA
jgi:hypothetical protein